MPRGSARAGRGSSAGVPATPETLLRSAEAALESGERRQRSGEDQKAIGYFQTVCSTLAGMRDDRQGCLLWATAMANLVELRASSWNTSGTMAEGIPNLRLAAIALERGHAAAVAASAESLEIAHLLSARAECAELLAATPSGDALSTVEDWPVAVRFAAEAAQLWEQSLAASKHDLPEAPIETLCSLGSASMAFGKMALAGGDGTGELDATTRRDAQAAVKRALGAFEEACGLCDSARGDDLPDVLAQWAQALWDAAEVVPPGNRAELLRRAVDKAAASVRLQKVPVPEAACLLGDVLIALGEHVWKARSSPADVGCNGGRACEALWHCRRALHEGYNEAMRVRSRDLSILCGMADALLDCGRLQRDMVTCGVDLAVAQPQVASEAPTPGRVAEAEAEAETEVSIVDLTEAVDQMQVDAPMQLLMVPPEPVGSLPPLPSAAECLERAGRLYGDALEASAAEWATGRVSRFDTMYNAACACALHGAREESCAKLLGTLAAEGALRRAELEADADLAPLVPTAWMQSLLQGLP
jgi:hypothetical protein